jgi:hypothetical protein
VATITAVLMLVLVSTALGLAANLFAQEARRTAQQRAGAQLRQLLLAGGAIAQNQIANDPSTRNADLSAALPAALASSGAWLTIALRPGDTGDRWLATVSAGVGHQAAEQRLVVGQVVGGWRIVEAQVMRQTSKSTRP